MKICVASSGKGLDSSVSLVFGRSPYFLILSEKGELLEVFKNEGVMAIRGAGVVAAQSILDRGANIVITGNIGPNSFNVLNSGGVEIFLSSGNSANEAFEKWKNGEFSEQKVTKDKIGRGFGMGRGYGMGRRGMGRGPNTTI